MRDRGLQEGGCWKILMGTYINSQKKWRRLCKGRQHCDTQGLMSMQCELWRRPTPSVISVHSKMPQNASLKVCSSPIHAILSHSISSISSHPTLLSHFFLTVLYLELVEDPIVHTHLSELYNTLLEQVCQTFHLFSPSPHTTLLSDE